MHRPHGTGGSGAVDEGVARPDGCRPRDDLGEDVSLLGHVGDPGLEVELDPLLEKRATNHRFGLHAIVEGGVVVAGEAHHVLVGRDPVDEVEQEAPAAHGESFLGGGEPAVVPHDPAGETRPQHLVQALDQHHVRPGLGAPTRRPRTRRSPRPRQRLAASSPLRLFVVTAGAASEIETCPGRLSIIPLQGKRQA